MERKNSRKKIRWHFYVTSQKNRIVDCGNVLLPHTKTKIKFSDTKKTKKKNTDKIKINLLKLTQNGFYFICKKIKYDIVGSMV